MPHKDFSLYSDGDSFEIQAKDQLIIEIGMSHIAVLIVNENRKSIAALEIFSFTEDEAKDINTVFEDVIADSKLLKNKIADTHIYFNSDCCVPVPAYRYDEQIAADYINIMFGEDGGSVIGNDQLSITPGMVNVYKIKKQLLDFLSLKVGKFTYHHTYTNVIKRISGEISALSSEFMSIQFYKNCIITGVVKDGDLQLIQTYKYETPDDVLYYILSVVQRFELNHDLTVQISGMINFDYKLYRDLKKYFNNIITDDAQSSNMMADITEYPLHYYSPFLNLAL